MTLVFLILLFGLLKVSMQLKSSLRLKSAHLIHLQATPHGLHVEDVASDVLEEVLSPRRLTVEGDIPEYIKGTLIRNGPGLFGSLTDPPRRYTHIFDGLAKLTRYHFNGLGEVNFSTQFIRSPLYDRIVKRKRDLPAVTTAGPTEPPVSKLANLVTTLATGSKYGNTNVNVHELSGIGGPLLAVTDAPFIYEVDKTTLQTKGEFRYPNKIVQSGGIELFSTAHPHALGGYSYNIFTEIRPGRATLVHLVRIDKRGYRTILGTITCPPNEIPYIHDFSITPNYAIIAVWPLTVPFNAMINGRGFMPQLTWEGNQRGTKIHVFSLAGKSDKLPLASYESAPLWAYHHVNAYEEGTEVVMDVCAYSTPGIVSGQHAFLYIPNILDREKLAKQERAGIVHRWRLPLPGSGGYRSGGMVYPEVLRATDEKGQQYESDLVTFYEGLRGRHYQYSYGMTGYAGNGPNRGDFLEWGLVKQDHSRASSPGSASVWKAPSAYPSEPIFIPRPNAKAEDDGVLVSQVYDGVRRETFLLVLDAATMRELARAYTGIRVPSSFHGAFLHD